jgi:hypothetical protein
VKATSISQIVIAVISLISGTACSRESPVAPGGLPASVSGQNQASAQTGAPGTYEISFLRETLQGLQPVLNYTLNVGEVLVLKSQITDSNGVPAEDGTVTYEYCERRNVRVSSAECESGRGRWTRLMSMPVDQFGSLVNFGSCSTPRTIGFRVRFNGQASGLASGVSAARDVFWQ